VLGLYAGHGVLGKGFAGGDVAQLGEHLLCKQGVVGSNPIISTTPAGAGVGWGCVRWLRVIDRHSEAKVRCGCIVGTGCPDDGLLAVMGAIRLDGAVVFFVRVNQVLVRLWARVMAVGRFGLAGVPLFGCMSDRESGLRLLRGAGILHPSGRAARVQGRGERFVGLVDGDPVGWPGAGRRTAVMCVCMMMRGIVLPLVIWRVGRLENRV
jgi:hypothetical protein